MAEGEERGDAEPSNRQHQAEGREGKSMFERRGDDEESEGGLRNRPEEKKPGVAFVTGLRKEKEARKTNEPLEVTDGEWHERMSWPPGGVFVPEGFGTREEIPQRRKDV